MEKIKRSEKINRSGNYLKLRGLTIGKGNLKLDKSIAIFNLPAIKTCPNCSQCAKTCYAVKPECIRPKVRACRQSNWDASKRDDFVYDMVALIKASKCPVVRIHESGDFYSQEYADKWSTIAILMPEIKFYAYTKSPYRPSASNINIVESILPDGSINFGPFEMIKPLADKYNAFICPCAPGDRAKHCGTSCTECAHRKYVVFLEH